MMEDNARKELIDLRERVVRLETLMEEVNKRVDSIAKYLKELYNYLQKQQSRPLF